ncbi:MAG: DNA-directed RNA polymerase subunit L [Candidatus Micrarchaeota archaeon]
MDAKVLSNEKNTLEMELTGMDQSLAQLLAEKLNQEKDVEFASYKVEHPLLGNPKLYVRTKKGEPAKLVLEKLDEMKKELLGFKEQFTQIVK